MNTTTEKEIQPEFSSTFKELVVNYERLQDQYKAANEDLQATLASRQQLELDSADMIKRLGDSGKSTREEVVRLRQQLGCIERDHLELVKSYRLLNDRYIRLRDQMQTKPATAPRVEKIRLI